MKHKKIWLIFIVSMSAMLMCMCSYPSFENKHLSNIKILKGDSLIYDLHKIPKGKFKYYLEQEPKQIEFFNDGKKIVIEDYHNEYKIRITYLSSPNNPLKEDEPQFIKFN